MDDDYQKITPWEVEVKAEGDTPVSIDYARIIKQFGCQEYSNKLTEKLARLSPIPLHFLLKRGVVFAHRDFDKILENIEKGRSFYLYTGRGPSSKSMHLGHAIPFLICKYFQDAFKIPLVIQITDDEKFLWKSMDLEEAVEYGRENIKDIIAFGFDPKLTFIFSNVEQSQIFYRNTLKIAKSISLNEAMKIFGIDQSYNIGQVSFPAKEIAPCFPSSFKFLNKNMMCLIPAAVDQDPYFRLARDKASVLKEKKPSSIYVSLLPDLKGVNKKMSASDEGSSIYLTDSSEIIKNKIKKYAYSGGKKTLKEHQEKGGDVEVDIPYQYMRYFLEDDDELFKLEGGYKAGSITSAQMKNRCIEVIDRFVSEYRTRRSKVTDEDVEDFKEWTDQ